MSEEGDLRIHDLPAQIVQLLIDMPHRCFAEHYFPVDWVEERD